MKIIDMSKMEQLKSMTREELRMICSNIHFNDEETKSICMTSTLPNAGKSFISLNLALIMAEGNSKVLYIDMDLRNSYTWRRVRFDKELPGAYHVLSGKKDADSAIYETSVKNFYLMPTGGMHKNPTSLLRNSAFRELILKLKEDFDYIIVDTPPIGLVTDASLVANACDGSVLVLSSREDNSKNARESIDALRKANQNFLGVILNKYEEKQDRRYGRYGRYGKYGKYGYGSYGGKD